MHLQLIENMLILPEDKTNIYKIAHMKVIAKVVNIDKIVPPEEDQISISIELEIQYQLSYTSTTSKNRVFVTTYQNSKIIYLTSQDLASQNEASKWDKAKFIEAIVRVEDAGDLLIDNRTIYTYTLLSLQLNEIKPIVREEEIEDEW